MSSSSKREWTTLLFWCCLYIHVMRQSRHLLRFLLCCCARMTLSSGEGPWKESSIVQEPSRSSKATPRIGNLGSGLVDSVRAKSVGEARMSGSFSSGSSGGGVGSRGGGVGSRFFLPGYVFNFALDCGVTFSLSSEGRLSRSKALDAPFVATLGGSAVALFRRSSASFASFDEPPRSFGRGAMGSTGTR